MLERTSLGTILDMSLVDIIIHIRNADSDITSESIRLASLLFCMMVLLMFFELVCFVSIMLKNSQNIPSEN